jgi:hypothetical protein
MDLPVAENAGVALTNSRNATVTHMAREAVIPTAIHYDINTTQPFGWQRATVLTDCGSTGSYFIRLLAA